MGARAPAADLNAANLAALLRTFPALGVICQTSDGTWAYNCHAFGAGITDAWWDPVDPARPGPHMPPWVRIDWPQGLPRNDWSLANFMGAFETMGYERCQGEDAETRVEKIALYASSGAVTHTARQESGGNWISKLGSNIDLHHRAPGALESASYGSVVALMQRPIA